MHKARAIACGLAGLLAAGLAGAQELEQQKLLARRAAEADAYRKLAEVVYGLQFNGRTYVRDFVTESDDIRGDVDTFVKGVRLGAPRWFDDGSCEMPAEVTVAKVVETLRTAHGRHYQGHDIQSSDFESLSRRLDKDVIRVLGHGAPRPDLPPDLPLGAEALLPPPPAALPPPPVPDLWKQVGPQARLSAERAAYMDAMRRLAERIKGLRLTARTQVRDFMVESDEITTELSTQLVGAQERGYYLHDDQLLAECTLAIPTEKVIETIKTLHSRHYKGDDVRGSDIENIARSVVRQEFTATGMGVPNPRFIQRFVQAGGAAPPDWAMAALEAEGEGTDPELDTPQGKLRAARAAELDARRKLAEQIAGLRLEAQTSVRDFVRQHDEIVGLVNAVVVEAVVVRTRFVNNTALVTIALPGARVWDAVNDAIAPR